MKSVGAIGFAVLAVLLFACRGAPQESSAKEESSPLILTAQIPLPGVHWRFDDFSFDPAEPGRIFISALGNNSVEVINTVEGTAVHSIPGIPEPQGIAFAIGLNKLFVASRKGKLYIYDGGGYNLITTIDYNVDVDNLRYDPPTKRVYVGYGDKENAAIGVVDASQPPHRPTANVSIVVG